MRTLPLFYQEINRILPAARQKRSTTIHSEMIMIYWKIGERMVENELQGGNRSEYGAFLTKDFSKDLSKQFGRGFSITNIKNFRQFYLAFRERSTASPSHKGLSWTHYRIIMRVKDPDARQYYVQEAAGKNWSTRQLARHIREQYYKGGSHSNIELNREKRLEERIAARAALDKVYQEIAAMAISSKRVSTQSGTEISIPAPAPDLHSTTMLFSVPCRSDYGTPMDRSP